MTSGLVVKAARACPVRGPEPSFLVVEGGTITRVGLPGESPPAGLPVLKIPGTTLVPGFVDSHTHFLFTGLNLTAARLEECTSRREILEQVVEQARSAPGWVRGHGYDETRLREGAPPTREELDRAAPGRPVFLSRRDHHSAVASSAALRFLEPEVRLSGSDTARGWLRGPALFAARDRMLGAVDREEKREALHRAAELAVSRGVTTVHALEGGYRGGEEDVDLILEEAPRLPLDLVLYPQTMDLEWVCSRGLPRVGGCLLVDGSLGSRTAALRSSYSDDPGNRGCLYLAGAALRRFVADAHRRGLQVALHAIGDRAIAQVVRAYREALESFPREDPRHRLEHGILPMDKDREALAPLGVAVGVQPAFEGLWGGPGGLYHRRLGRRAARTHPFRDLLASGVRLGGGSDSDVTPLDPLLGMHWARNLPREDQRLTLGEALDLFTRGAASLAFEEDRKGTLEAGKQADLVLLGGDPEAPPGGRLEQLPVIMTLRRGRVVFSGRSPGSGPPPESPARPERWL